jgi:putative ABC transport system permease protein
MLSLALKNLLVRKTRTALSLLGLTIAILGIIALISVSRGIQALLQETLNLVPGITVLQKEVPALALSAVPRALGEELETLPGVHAAFAQVWYPAFEVEGENLALQGNPFQLYLVLGVEIGAERRFRDEGPVIGNLREGRAIVEGRDEVLIPRAAAERFKKRVGDRIRILRRDLEIVGIFQSGSLFFDRCLVVPLRLAREMSAKDESFVSSFYLELEDGADPDALSVAIDARWPKVRAWTLEEVNRQSADLWAQLDVFLLAIASIAVTVGALGIVNTMLMSVMERTGELGVLRATGWTRGDVVRLILVESAALGVGGGLLGCALGAGAVALAGALLPLRPVVTPALLLGCFGLALVLGTTGGLYPAWRASRLDPIAAIRS